MLKVISFIKELFRDTVADVMERSNMDTSDLLDLCEFEERGFWIFGILVGISAILYGVFGLTLLPIFIVAYMTLDLFAIIIGVTELEKEEIDRIDNEWKELEKEMESMKRMF